MQEEQKKWAEDTLGRVERKLAKVSERSAAKIPYSTVRGVHDDRSGDIGWWTNGFWGGMMWQMYRLTGEEKYRQIAEDNEKKLDACFLDYGKLDHDNGFKWLPTAVADYRLTKSEASKNRGLLAAGNLAGRYNSKGCFIRAWNDWGDEDHRGWAIIDCMMNLPLLYWASEETGDPRFRQIAVSHANTAMRAFVRGDGSVNHIVGFDPETGEKVTSYGGQGYGTGSSWTRGQSWGLYGFTLSYLHTKDEAYLDTAIAACGLIELAKLREGRQGKVYLDAALKLLYALTEHSTNWNEDEDNLLEKCTAAYHDREHEFSIIYGDYYFLEALMKLAGKDLFIW